MSSRPRARSVRRHARSSSLTVAGAVNTLALDAPGKQGGGPPSFSALSRPIVDLAVAPSLDLLCAAGDDGSLSLSRLTATALPERVADFSTQRALLSIRWHPHAADTLLAFGPSSFSIFDASSPHAAALDIAGPTKGLWDAAWTSDGRTIASVSKDNLVRLWDPRSGSEATAVCRTAMARLTRPGDGGSRWPESEPHRRCRISAVHDGASQAMATGANRQGFSKMRDREYSLYDPRQFTKPVKTQRLDSNTGILVPVVDAGRSIVYLAGRGDMQLRWTEIGGPSTFTDGALRRVNAKLTSQARRRYRSLPSARR